MRLLRLLRPSPIRVLSVLRGLTSPPAGWIDSSVYSVFAERASALPHVRSIRISVDQRRLAFPQFVFLPSFLRLLRLFAAISFSVPPRTPRCLDRVRRARCHPPLRMSHPRTDPTRLISRGLCLCALLCVVTLTLIDRGSTRAYATPWIYLFWFAHAAPLLALALRAPPTPRRSTCPVAPGA